MKKLEKLLTIIIAISIILSSVIVVNAANAKDVTITAGSVTGNTVTFTVKLLNGAILMGDVNDNGVVNEVDPLPISQYIANPSNELTQVQKNAADLADRGNGITLLDSAAITNLFQQLGIRLSGTLANDSTLKVEKLDSSTDDVREYKATVTFPENANGTVGVKLSSGINSEDAHVSNLGAVAYTDGTTNTSDIEELITLPVQNDDDNNNDGTNEKLNISISDGAKDANKVTFEINLPEGATLRGDVNGDLVVDDTDRNLMQSNESKANSDEINNIPGFNVIAADVNGDGRFSASDIVAFSIEQIKGTLTNKFSLNGTLAENSTLKLVQNNGKYVIEVEIPSDATEGTIGVTVGANAFVGKNGMMNDEVSSKLFELSAKEDETNNSGDTSEFKVTDESQKNTDSGKVLVTVTTNEEIDPNKLPEGWNLNEDKKSISKEMEDGKTEDIKIVSVDGNEVTHKVTAVLFKVVSKTEEPLNNDQVKVTINLNKPVKGSTALTNAGWKINEDGKSITATLKKDTVIGIEIYDFDDNKISYSFIVGHDKDASSQSDKKDDGKDEGKEDGRATTNHPQTGENMSILFVIAGVAILGGVVFIRLRKFNK